MKKQPNLIAIGTSIHEAAWLASTAAGQATLALAHETDEQPRCMCVPGGAPMTIRKRGESYSVVRMPSTGFIHGATCPWHEAIDLFAGDSLYESGTITIERSGKTKLHLNIDNPASQSPPLTEVRIDGLCDFLIASAGLNSMRPDEHPRSARFPATRPNTWESVRKSLLSAAECFVVDGAPLTETLFIPERFSADAAAAPMEEIERRVKKHRTALIMAPLKEIRQASFSWQIVLKQLPNLRLWLPKEVATIAASRTGFPSLENPPEFALCVVAIHAGRREGNFTVSNLAVRPTDAAFRPWHTARESEVVGTLLAEKSVVMHPMRFDAPPTAVLADFACSSGGQAPKPVFILNPSGNATLDKSKAMLCELMRRNHVACRVFD